MAVIRLFLVLLSIIALSSVYFEANCQKEGSVIYTTDEYLYRNSSGTPILTSHQKKIWFKDSTVIYEIRINRETTESTADGLVTKKSNPVLRYSLLNLRNMIGQDYLIFTDSATPVSNFRLQPDETLSWTFYKSGMAIDTSQVVTKIADTIIGSTPYRRIRMPYPLSQDETGYCLYYLQKTKGTIFQLNRLVDSIYKGWRTTLLQLFDQNNNLLLTSKLEVPNGVLTKKERSIFVKWGKNARATKLPLLNSLSEAEAIKIRMPDHENPVISVEPKNRKQH
jgi:hypothetical protein